MSDDAVVVTESSFATEVLQSKIPVLVDFWAPWCGPCRKTAPIVEEIAIQFAGKIKVAKVNVDDNQELSTKYNIRGIPSLLLFKDGEVADTNVGMVTKSQLVDFINKNLNI
jgi:thioredoxin 1